MQTRHAICGIMVALTAAIPISPGRAQTSYTDKNAFNGAATVATDITFEGLVGTANYPQNRSSGYAETYNPNGITVAGTRFVGSGYIGSSKNPETYIYSQAAVNASVGHDVSMNGSGYTLWGGREYIDIDLPSGTSAFGTDFGLVNATGPIDFTVYFHDGTTQTAALTAAAPSQFFGITGTDINHINIHSPLGDPPGDAPYMQIDNVLLGTEGVTSTPEPGTIAILIGMSFTGAGLVARRRIARQSA